MAYGDPKVVVDVKDAEHGEIVYTDEAGKQHTYYPTHSIWLEVQTLQVSTSLGDPKEEGQEPPVVTRLHGTAVLEDYSISVVGDPKSKVRTLTISFEASDWRPKHEPNENPLLSGFGKVLGGAMLGFNRADWEVGNSDEWWISCYLPQHYIDALVADIRSGQINSMKVGLMLRQLYTTEHSMAPVSSRGHLFLRPDKRDNTIAIPEMANGIVRGIYFASAPRHLRKPELPEPEEPSYAEDEPSALPPEDPVATAIAVLAARIELMRGTVKWVGGLIVAALVILALK